MAAKRYAEVDQYRCVSCGACTHDCPKEAISVWKGCYAVVDRSLCIGCGRCEKVCPAGSITIITITKGLTNE
ncbi:MAG: 4Fe-4S binding protein [Lachnospiraceae bacterium]|nr:4Fe-4S binding protein [Lachnospiraceae bacterium]